ncbi:unnamed protein product [Boreogadus saida]
MKTLENSFWCPPISLIGERVMLFVATRWVAAVYAVNHPTSDPPGPSREHPLWCPDDHVAGRQHAGPARPLVRVGRRHRPPTVAAARDAAGDDAAGDDKVVKGDDKVVKGDDKVVKGDDKVVKGDDKVVKGDDKVVKGDDKVGRLEGIEVQRLKDKLGTRQMPTAELLLDGLPAHRVSGSPPPPPTQGADAPGGHLGSRR